MKLAWVSDVHLGNHKRFGGPVIASLNERCRRAVDVFDDAVGRAIELECSALFVLGDLFDYCRPEAQLLARVQVALEHAKASGVTVFLLVGNHEQTSLEDGDHALGPLRPYATIVDQPQVFRVYNQRTPSDPRSYHVDVGLIPFRPGAPAKAWLPEAIEHLWASQDDDYNHRLLGVHLGISDDNTAPWLKNAADSIPAGEISALAQLQNVEAVFAGNWHNRQLWKGAISTPVFQLGALVPTGFDNPGPTGYGTLGLWTSPEPDRLGQRKQDTAGKISFEELPGPRFLKLAPGELPDGATISAGHHLYLSTSADRADLPERQAALARLSKHVDVSVDTSEALVSARTAATVARSASTVEEAVAGFVGQMPLPDGVERVNVLKLTNGFLIEATKET